MNIFMRHGDTSLCGTNPGITCGIIDRIHNVTILHKLPDLFYCHFGTVILGFLCRSPQMWCDNGVRKSCCRRIREIHHIFLHLSPLQCLLHIRFIDQCISGEVQEYHAVLHLVKGFFIKHSLSGIQKRHVNGDKITLAVNLLIGFHKSDVPGHIQRIIHGKIWVASIYFHSKTVCRICHQHTDGSKTDNTKFFTGDLGSGKCLLRLFRCLGDISILFIVFHPLDTTDDIAGSKDHRCYNQLFYTIGISSRCIEYDDSLFRTLLQRNIVDAGAGSRHGGQVIRQLHIVHGGASHQHSLCCIYILHNLIFIIQKIQTACRDRIQAVHFYTHTFPHFCVASASSNFFINSTSFSTPSFGIAL